MVGEVVASVGVGKDGELAAVEHEPLGDVAELVGGNCQLTAAARMRTDGTEMVMALGNAEFLVGGVPERLRLLDLLRIEIDVGVEVADHVPPVLSAIQRVQK